MDWKGLLKTLLTCGTARRIYAGLLATAIILANKKFNLGLDNAEVFAIAGTAVAYILGSNAKEAAVAKAIAASAPLPATADNEAILNELRKKGPTQ